MMACGWAWLWRSSLVALGTKVTSEGRVRVFKTCQHTSTSWGKLAGTPIILMNDPTRVTSAARALRAKTSAVEEQAEIELGWQATVTSPGKSSTPRTWSDRIVFELRTYSS